MSGPTPSSSRQSSARPRRSCPSTSLVEYLNHSSNWSADETPPLPIIKSEPRLRRARNSVKRSKDNNDILEFIGDRVNNLACTLMVEKVKLSSEHHKAVGRVLCNNDTLARIAYQLRLHEEAILGHHDEKEVKTWLPASKVSPPKALADLFEAYVGAVYEEQGWETVMKWVTALYKPLIDLATEDFLHRADPTRPISGRPSEELPEEVVGYQGKLLDYLEFKGLSLAENGREAIDALPPSTQFFFGDDGSLMNDSDRAEVATNLINFWICKSFMRVYPQLLQASYKGAHLITWITRLVTSDETIGYLGFLLSLSAFFDTADVDYQSTRRFTIAQDQVYRNKLSSSMKALVGWYYLKDSVSAEKWGEKWFKYIVMRVHDIIAEDPNYKLSLPESALDTYSIHAAAIAASDQKSNYTSTSLADLTRDLENISLSHSPQEEPVGDDDEVENIVLVARVKDKSLTKFRPLPKVSRISSSASSKYSDPREFNSRQANITMDSPPKITKGTKSEPMSRPPLNNIAPERQPEPPMSAEQTLISAFQHIKIGGVKADRRPALNKVNAPLKLVISPETVSRLTQDKASA